MNPRTIGASKAQQALSAEIKKQHRAILAALDKLFVHEVPTGARPRLRLAWPVIEAIDRDPVGEGLRVFIARRGRDLWSFGGEVELFLAMRAVMAARPGRQSWNRAQLMDLWSDIGAPSPRESDLSPTRLLADPPVLDPAS
jgi:hypothetical protein